MLQLNADAENNEGDIRSTKVEFGEDINHGIGSVYIKIFGIDGKSSKAVYLTKESARELKRWL